MESLRSQRGAKSGAGDPAMIGQSTRSRPVDYPGESPRPLAETSRRRGAADGHASGIGYTFRLPLKDSPVMEAEQINQIAASIEGLSSRTADLRRYL